MFHQADVLNTMYFMSIQYKIQFTLGAHIIYMKKCYNTTTKYNTEWKHIKNLQDFQKKRSLFSYSDAIMR